MDEDNVEKTKTVADYDCNFGGDVAGGVLGAEGLGAYYVAGTC